MRAACGPRLEERGPAVRPKSNTVLAGPKNTLWPTITAITDTSKAANAGLQVLAPHAATATATALLAPHAATARDKIALPAPASL